MGGDTLWADTAAAYAGLPQDVKDRIDGLYAEHDIIRSFGGRVTPEKRAELNATYPPQRHPVVRTHPETGEKILYVNHVFTTRILGIDEDESAALLNLLFDRIKVPEYQVRFRWTPNAIAIWDNRSTALRRWRLLARQPRVGTRHCVGRRGGGVKNQPPDCMVDHRSVGRSFGRRQRNVKTRCK